MVGPGVQKFCFVTAQVMNTSEFREDARGWEGTRKGRQDLREEGYKSGI